MSQWTPKRLSPDPEWIRTRLELLRSIKLEVAARLGPEPADLRRFRLRYERELARAPWQPARESDLAEEVAAADIVYGGDFHALAQAQRTHLRILRALPQDRRVVLCLECFSREAQKWLDLYCAGKIDLDELREKSRWRESWGFPWDHYRPLFELARKRRYRLVGLNVSHASPKQSHLRAREEFSAAILRQELRSARGQALLYVIYGDLHLAKRHLPALVRSRGLRELVVHLNPEKIYFQLARKGLELGVDVARMGERRFAVLSSPPWVQWQSYLLFLEHSPDSDLDRDEEDDAYDPTDQVAHLIRLAARDLGLKFKIDDLAVKSADDNSVWESLERSLKPVERAVARQLLARGHSVFLPKIGMGYLSRATINHASALAGQYIHARLSQRRRNLWRMPTDFSALIWCEATAYFFSKIINHRRRSETPASLQASLAAAGGSSADHGREAMKLAMDRLMSELLLIKQGRLRPLRFKPRRKASYFEAARILGGMLGERLYMRHRSRKIAKRDIVAWLKIDVSKRSFRREYLEILKKLGDDGVTP